MVIPTNYIELKTFLDEKVATYNQPSFIKDDPVSIPHQFSRLQDIEIMGFWSCLLYTSPSPRD